MTEIKISAETVMLSAEELAQGWQPMSSAPKDGTRFDLLCCSIRSRDASVVPKIYYGEPIMRERGTRVLRGEQNILSPYIVPVGWRLPVEVKKEEA